MPQNGSILTQLKSMPPPASQQRPSPLRCASSGDDCDHPECWLFLHLPAAAAAAPRSVAVLTHSLQHCSTAALQHCKHWPRAACSAAAPAPSTPRLYAARPGSCSSQHCHTARLLQHCSTAARTQDTRICIGRDLPLYFCNLMFMETCCCFMLQSTLFLAC